MGHKIRTTINPGEVLEVDDAEFLDLSRQNLISEVVGEPKSTNKKEG